MTKNIVALITIFGSCLYGMENIPTPKQSFHVVVKESKDLPPIKINLVKGYWEDYVDTVDMMVVGNHQQNMLKADISDHLEKIGHVYGNHNLGNSIYKINKETDSASDDDTYKPHSQRIDKQTWRDSYETKSLILHTEEPCIRNVTHIGKYINVFGYQVRRPHPNDKKMVLNLFFIKDKAIEEASKDLTKCYNNALIAGTDPVSYKNRKKSIGFPTLGADVGFPRDKAAPIAVKAVFKFVRCNPVAYENITFFVKKRSDFARYKLLLMKRVGLLYKICLFYWIYDNHDILKLMPKELKDYIVRLI